MVTPMFYHFYAPEDGHPTWEEKFIEKNARSFSLATLVNLINRSSDILFQKVQQIYNRLVNMNTFPLFYYWPITKHFST